MDIKRFVVVLLAMVLLLSCGCVVSVPNDNTTFTGDEPDTLEVHFIDVGQGESILVMCGGEAMLVDGGTSDSSSTVVSYLKNHGVETIDVMVCTHAHEDHVGGLSGPLNACKVERVLSPVTEYSTKAFDDFVKYSENQGLDIEVPSVGDEFTVGSASVKVFGPVREYEETNDTSIVLKVTFGETSFLLTGDAEKAAEKDIIESGANLNATVLSAGHHGSSTSTSYQFLREIMPVYAVISCGEDNEYGHPHVETMSLFADADVIVYRTDMQGSVVAVSDGEEISFSVDRNADIQTNPYESDGETVFIGNKNSKKFHRETCGGLPAEENRVYFYTYSEAVELGYSPCGNCMN